MYSQRRFLFVLSVVLLDRAALLALPVCDSRTSADLPEGNIGESAHFPWLGVLRVHLHHGDSLKIALTGLVLVKPKYAIANSDDIAKIPKNVFREDSKAMFLPKSSEPWYCKPKDYSMHPEYEYSTFNTIALVELLLDDFERAPFDPICWPGYLFNTSNQLYALGFTDEHEFLEKIMYKVDYVKPSLCDEFYSRAGLQEYKMAPMHLLCGFARSNKKDCDWENGMALASNSSGKWHLIGISLRGPGCSAPARFIDMFQYLPWIESATDLEEINDFASARRAEPNPIEPVNPMFAYKYHGDLATKRPFIINRIDKDAINIVTFDEKYEREAGDCARYKNMIYREKMKIVDGSGQRGRATYRISLYDMHMSGYTCVKLKIKSLSRDDAKLWYRYMIDPDDTFIHSGVETPKQLLKYNPVFTRDAPTTPLPPGAPWRPGPHLVPEHYIKDNSNYTGIKNLNILVWFTFSEVANLDVEVYGLAHPVWSYGEPPSTTSKPKKNKTTTETPQYRRKFDGYMRQKIKRLRFNFKSQKKNKTEKLNTSLRRTKYKHNKKYNRKKNKNLDKDNFGSLNPIISNEVPDSKSFNIQKHPGDERLHQSYQSHERTEAKNPFRLQKAFLRELERLSQGSSSRNETN